MPEDCTIENVVVQADKRQGLCESPGQCGSQYRRWTKTCKPGFLRDQELPDSSHFGGFQRSVPGGDLQYPEPGELWDAEPNRLYGEPDDGGSTFYRGNYYQHIDKIAASTVRIEDPVLIGSGAVQRAIQANAQGGFLDPQGVRGIDA